MRFIVLPGLAGSLAGLVAVAGLLALDVGSLGTLVLGPAGGVVPVAMLCGRVHDHLRLGGHRRGDDGDRRQDD